MNKNETSSNPYIISTEEEREIKKMRATLFGNPIIKNGKKIYPLVHLFEEYSEYLSILSDINNTTNAHDINKSIKEKINLDDYVNNISRKFSDNINANLLNRSSYLLTQKQKNQICTILSNKKSKSISNCIALFNLIEQITTEFNKKHAKLHELVPEEKRRQSDGYFVSEEDIEHIKDLQQNLSKNKEINCTKELNTLSELFNLYSKYTLLSGDISAQFGHEEKVQFDQIIKELDEKYTKKINNKFTEVSSVINNPKKVDTLYKILINKTNDPINNCKKLFNTIAEIAKEYNSKKDINPKRKGRGNFKCSDSNFSIS